MNPRVVPDFVMTINSLTGSTASLSTQAATTNTPAATAAAAATPLGQILKKAGTKLQSQLDTTSAQISAFGKLKAAVSDAQLGARALSNLPATSGTADVKAAAQRFVASFNVAVKAALSTDASAGEGATTRKVGSLGRALLPYSASTDALRRIGIKQAADGSLTFDANKFDAAQKADPAGVQKTLAGAGEAIDKSAAKELLSDGKLGTSMASLSQRSKSLLAQQSALLAVKQPTTATTTTDTATATDWRYALGAYAANA